MALSMLLSGRNNMTETALVSVRMRLDELSGSGGAVFKYDGDGVAPVVIPREAWAEYGRPVEVRVRIFAIEEVDDERTTD